jgi:hypothetical protein
VAPGALALVDHPPGGEIAPVRVGFGQSLLAAAGCDRDEEQQTTDSRNHRRSLASRKTRGRIFTEF